MTAELTLTSSGPDAEIVRTAAVAAVREYVDDFAIGRDIRRSRLIAGSHVPSVESVGLAAPPADVVVGDAQFGTATAVTITVA